MSILVLDGDQRSALTVVRSLGRAGYQVTCGDEKTLSLASASKYSSGSISYPSPSSQPSAFQEFLLKHLQENAYELLIPCTDRTCILALELEDEIRSRVKLALPPREIFMQAFNKHLIVDTAKRVGVAAPQTFLINSKSDLEAANKAFCYPGVLKAIQSHTRSKTGWISGGVKYVISSEEAELEYLKLGGSVPVMLQEQVIGSGCGYFALMKDGALLAESSHVRLREKPPSGGVSVLCKSVPIDSKLREGSLALLRELKWDGLAMVEYKRDRDSGEYKIMEVNGRVWGSLQLAIDSGVDFPRLLAELTFGGKCSSVSQYKSGVVNRWLLGDIDHLFIILKRGAPRARGFGKIWSRIAALLKFFGCFLRPTHGSVLRFSDMGPWFRELRHYVSWHLKSRS